MIVDSDYAAHQHAMLPQLPAIAEGECSGDGSRAVKVPWWQLMS
jgi:hypothetical protein